jgi:hypothetical protein
MLPIKKRNPAICQVALLQSKISVLFYQSIFYPMSATQAHKCFAVAAIMESGNLVL